MGLSIPVPRPTADVLAWAAGGVAVLAVGALGSPSAAAVAGVALAAALARPRSASEATPAERPSLAHPVSGLPMREALLAAMAADGTGMLGALQFDDVDRLTAFDPGLADRLFAAATARLTAMLPTGRLAAQVDRGQVAIWFGPADPQAARAELDAIGYALGGVVEDGDERIAPQVRRRLARFDGPDAPSFLHRTLASFSMAEAQAVAAEAPADQAALARERFALERDLREAVVRRELRLQYQPLIDAGKGCVCGAEALIRWDHPELGPVSPGRFVPVMEAIGLAPEIGLWALNTAVREARDWAAAGLGHLRIAVNVSAVQLDGDDLPVLVARTLERHDVPAAALELELTESVATSDAAHCRRLFEQLRGLGVSLAVDDFGTGYSGFASLRGLRFDKIKIDRAFVTDVDRRRDSQAICQSMIALGRGLGIRVLAEGVERREEYRWLRRHGCQHYQGYLFGRPMDGAAFVAFARDRARLAALLAPTHDIQRRMSA